MHVEDRLWRASGLQCDVQASALRVHDSCTSTASGACHASEERSSERGVCFWTAEIRRHEREAYLSRAPSEPVPFPPHARTTDPPSTGMLQERPDSQTRRSSDTSIATCSLAPSTVRPFPSGSELGDDIVASMYSTEPAPLPSAFLHGCNQRARAKYRHPCSHRESYSTVAHPSRVAAAWSSRSTGDPG